METRIVSKSNPRKATVRLCVTAMLMALNIVLSMSIFAIPVLGGKVYVNDIVIVLAALLLNPAEAFVVGGVGAFIGDLLFYPAPMFVSLVTRGLQAFLVSYISHKALQSKPKLASVVAVAVGAVINVLGYTLGKIFVYSTFEYAMVKLPYQILMAVVGGAIGYFLCCHCGIRSVFKKTVGEN
ncbi:MAG: ECF transporter S component [Clostridia bacterium]|nr:ECF transporter S component [Clostridia bacterium]